MKQFLLLTISMLLVCCCTEAQISAGLKAGLNLSALKGSDYNTPEQKTLMGIAIGGLVNYAINEKLSVQPELLYSQEGAQWKGEYEQKNLLNYLNIPLLVQYDNPSGFYGHTGPQIGFLLSAKMKYKEPNLPGTGTIGEDQPGSGVYETRDIKKVYSGTNLSWAFGAGYRHESGFGINARYNIGLSNVLGKHGDGKIHSSVFNIGIAYMLTCLKK
jgi:hypothetical protein